MIDVNKINPFLEAVYYVLESDIGLMILILINVEIALKEKN